MSVNLEWYRMFYVTARSGSLSKAAAELFITQPAVSHAIRQLEQKLEVQLFFRMAKGVRMTAEGEVLYRFVEEAYTSIAAGERKISDMRGLLVGEMKIGAGDTLCRHVLLPVLSRFHRQFPDIRLQVTNRTSLETIRLLKEGKIDFGIVHLPVPQDKQLAVSESMKIQDIFIANPGHPALAAGPLPLSALAAAYPLIMLEKGSSSRAYLDHVFTARGIALQPEIELGSIDLLVQFARNGLGLSCVSREFVKEELRQGEVAEIPLLDPLPPRAIGIITLKDVPISAAARRFIGMLPDQTLTGDGDK